MTRIFTEEEDLLLRDATIRNINNLRDTGNMSMKEADEYADRTQAELVRNYFEREDGNNG